MMFWYGHDMGWWGYAGMGVGMLLFWALLIAGIVVLIKFLVADHAATPPPASVSPEQILAARFAGGEITDTEYREGLAVLRQEVRH